MTEAREIALVLGTAGHIDHGKTTLVGALTGVDCDRLLEEKKRGITIELGFAPLRLADGRVVSIIDVPGHERFIRQMVAGASGIDAVMLIVAADESVMPQTREHLAILELLGVRDGVVVITKADRVEPEMLELVEEDVADFLKGTFLEGKTTVSVSAVSGQNIEALKKALAALIDRVRPRPRKGAFFLPIDRAFPVAGFGTVVTGTAYRGTARPGDETEIFPSGKEAKIRTLQVHGRTVEEAWAGQRVAVNLSGVSVDELARGDVVCRRGVYSPTRCFDAVARVLHSAAEPLKHWQRVRVYIGTSDVLARVSLPDGKQIAPGDEAPAQLVLEEDIVCTAEQRFIIRFYSPLVTIGGGRVVFPYSYRPRGTLARRVSAERIRALAAIGAEADTDKNSGKNFTDERLALLVEHAGMLDFDRACRAVQEDPQGLSAAAGRLLKNGRVEELKGEKSVYLSHCRMEELSRGVAEVLNAWHNAHPSEEGMPTDDLTRAVSGLLNMKNPDVKAARSLMGILLERGTLFLSDSRARLPGFVPKNDEALRRNAEALISYCRQRGFQPPTLEEAAADLKMDRNTLSTLVQILKNARRLVLLSGEYLFSDEMEKETLSILRGIKGDVTLAAVRDATGSSRKFILPVLEYFDSKGYTRRVGDVRVVKKSE